MRRRPGFTLVELMVAMAIAGVLGLLVFAYLSSGFNFALASEEFGSQSLAVRAAADRIARSAQEARGHRIYQGYAQYQAGTPVAGGTAGSCLRLYLPTETRVYWRDAATGRLLGQTEGSGSVQVLARNVTSFQARCVNQSRVVLSLEATAPSASDITATRIVYTTTVFLRNFDGSADSCLWLPPWRPS